MKKILSLFTLIAIVVTMVSCSAVNNGDSNDYSIAYGKKYMLDEGRYYVFERDQTGYYECYYHFDSNLDPEYDYTLSGRVDFVWRDASNGAIYLFETKTTYNKEDRKSVV